MKLQQVEAMVGVQRQEVYTKQSVDALIDELREAFDLPLDSDGLRPPRIEEYIAPQFAPEPPADFEKGYVV